MIEPQDLSTLVKPEGSPNVWLLIPTFIVMAEAAFLEWRILAGITTSDSSNRLYAASDPMPTIVLLGLAALFFLTAISEKPLEDSVLCLVAGWVFLAMGQTVGIYEELSLDEAGTLHHAKIGLNPGYGAQQHSFSSLEVSWIDAHNGYFPFVAFRDLEGSVIGVLSFAKEKDVPVISDRLERGWERINHEPRPRRAATPNAN